MKKARQSILRPGYDTQNGL